MNRFQVILTEHAVTDLKDIPKELRDQVHQDLKALESSPSLSPPKVKRLRTFRPPLYRLRSGEYRVLYRVQGNIVTILRIIDRKILERVIKRL